MAGVQKTERIFLDIMSEILHKKEGKNTKAVSAIQNAADRNELISRLLGLSKQQKILPMTYDFFCKNEIDIPDGYTAFINREISSYALTYFQNVYFTDLVCRILDKEKISYALIKGMLLCQLYPNPMYRRFGDIDIYVNEKEHFQRAGALLEKNGFTKRPSTGDHHYEYILEKKGRLYLIELHQKLISSQENETLNQKIEMMYQPLKLDKILPTTYDALYLLLHMLQHLLDAGFGIKLLCDWVLYLEQKNGEIDAKKLKELLDELNLFPFAESITNFCIEYLGLTIYPDCFFHDRSEKAKNALRSLAEDIFAGGEFGGNDTSRMIIMKGQFKLKDYFLELHRQTKKNYPVLWKTILLLPFLWIFSGIQFLYNNKKIRHTDMKKIMETTKKRQKLLDDMEIRL